jgi:PAS domain S-box-containing protein
MIQPPEAVPPLFANADRLQLFIAGIKDYAIYMLSPEGNIMSWNAGAARFKGYAAEEILGKHFSRFYTGEDQAAGLPAQALQTALIEGKFESEGWRVRKDGRLFWASVVIDAIRDGSGKHIGFAKITRDMDERRQAQLALRASEERFRLLVQGVTDYAIYMLSPSGEVTNWNSGARGIKGYSHDEVVGTHFSRFYTAEDQAAGAPARALATAARENRFEGEGWRVRKDGTRFWAHVVIDAIRSDSGELIGFGKVTRDTTERRDAAQALERAKEALFQAQKLEAIGKLTGGVAHDFNNLLSVIVSGLEIISKEVKTPAGVKTLSGMQRAASRGAKLTQQLLSFARQQPLRPEKYNLTQLVTAFEAVLHRARPESVALKLQLDPSVRPVLLDAVQFEAALLNLMSNACDAMPGGGTLTITVENVQLAQEQVGSLAGGEYVKLTLSDTGTGMTPEVAARAVEPFYTTKPIGEGTGLGLSQAYGLVQQSGGDLEIESQPGIGTSISLYWPALTLSADESTSSPDTNAGAERALVVDDQPDVLETMVELLQTMGYEVLSANNGAEALETLDRHGHISVLLSDVVMAGMDGVTLARESRKRCPTVKVILVSGFPRDNFKDQHGDMASFGFLMKPFRMAELAKLLRQGT